MRIIPICIAISLISTFPVQAAPKTAPKTQAPPAPETAKLLSAQVTSALNSLVFTYAQRHANYQHSGGGGRSPS